MTFLFLFSFSLFFSFSHLFWFPPVFAGSKSSGGKFSPVLGGGQDARRGRGGRGWDPGETYVLGVSNRDFFWGCVCLTACTPYFFVVPSMFLEGIHIFLGLAALVDWALFYLESHYE